MANLPETFLVLTEVDFESVLRQQLFDHELWATGTARWRTTHVSREILVQSLTTSASLPRGEDYPPLEDLFVMHVVAGGKFDPRRILAEIQPRRSQTFVVLEFDALDHASWAGDVYRDGEFIPLDGFRLVGGGMVEVAALSAPASPVHQRYQRLVGAVGEEVIRKLQPARVTLVGVSRNGTLMGWQLAALGIRHVRLMDFDQLEPHNYDIMIGIDADTIHTKKVFAFAEALLRYRPDMSVTCSDHSALDPEAQMVFDQPTDLVISCTDNLSSRVAVSIQAQRTLVPHLDIGTSVRRDADNNLRIFGDARLFLPRQGCCFCTPPLSAEDREEVLYELSAPPDTLQRGEVATWSSERAGSLITINNLTVAAGVQMWLDLLAGDLSTSFWQRLDWHPGRGLEVNSSTMGAADDCPYCTSAR